MSHFFLSPCQIDSRAQCSSLQWKHQPYVQRSENSGELSCHVKSLSTSRTLLHSSVMWAWQSACYYNTKPYRHKTVHVKLKIHMECTCTLHVHTHRHTQRITNRKPSNCRRLNLKENLKFQKPEKFMSSFSFFTQIFNTNKFSSASSLEASQY